MIRFLLDKPPSVNSMFRNVPGRGRVRTGAYREWSLTAMADMMAQRVGQPVPTPPVAITITLPDEGGRFDADNFIKAPVDCLVQMGVIPDDNRKVVKRITVSVGGVDKGRCLVTVEPMEAV